ncbi:MAG: copper chaperone PCu(A)C [Betaproteobacteria bacterium]|nr:copper chaperone PCu(A)C [Betaproteobacteria bacterium]
MKTALLLVAFIAAPAMAQVTVTDAWTRATAPGAQIAAGYMTIKNAGKAPDKLVSASSPVAEKVETHVTVKEGDIFRMREVKGFDIPAGGSYELKPGGAHLMLMNVKAPLKEGDKVPLTLRFERAGEVKTELQVGRLTDTGKHSH